MSILSKIPPPSLGLCASIGAPALLSRRRVLKTAAAALVAGAGLRAAPAWCQQAQAAGAPDLGSPFWASDRRLSLRHASGDVIDEVYWAEGQLNVPGYLNFCRFFRDRVVGEVVTIDVALFDILYGIAGWLRYYNVSSGFVATSCHRERHRNRLIEGAALDSRHISGQAVDGYIPGVNTLMLASFARWLGAGGVGWYPQRGFVHVDTGTRRTWRG